MIDAAPFRCLFFLIYYIYVVNFDFDFRFVFLYLPFFGERISVARLNFELLRTSVFGESFESVTVEGEKNV